MAAKDYVKADSLAFADSVDAIVEAVKGDGVGMHLLDEAFATMRSAANVVNEAKDVPGAFGLHVAGRIADKQGDALLAVAIAKEEAADPV